MKEEDNKMKALKIALCIVLAVIVFSCGVYVGMFNAVPKSDYIEKLRKENDELKQQISQLTQNTETKRDVIDSNDEDYKVQFVDKDTSMFFGSSDRNTEIKDVFIKYSPRMKKYLLVIDFRYKNNTPDAHNFINDSYCSVTAFQNGMELDSPGITSEENVYNTNDSYKSIKNTEIDAQLAFVLLDTESDIELELGWDSPQIQELIITKAE